MSKLISEQQIHQWRTQGFCHVQLPESVWGVVKKYADQLFPKDRPDDFVDDFGSVGTKYNGAFPSRQYEVDMLPLNDEIIKIVQILLKTKHIRLTQGMLAGKWISGPESPLAPCLRPKT